MSPTPDASSESPLPTRSMDLVRRAQAGETSAFNRLVERYYERIRAIIRLRMGARLRSYMESGDVLQETFVAAIRAFDRFEIRDEGGFLHWLAKLAENQIRAAADHHHARKRDRRRDRVLEAVRDSMASGELRLEPAAPGPLPIDRLAAAEEIDFVMLCAEDLSDHHRELFLLRHFIYDDGRWDEIAQAAGSPSAQAARMTYARAVTALLRNMEQRGSALQPPDTTSS